MAIPTSRTQENADILIDESLCNGCGLCVTICKDFSLAIKDHKATVSEAALFGCIGCGHCMMVCPRAAISIEGRCTSTSDLMDIPNREDAASHETLLALMQRRRAMREFKDKPVDKELVEKVIAAASTAPMGLPPSDVHVLVLDTKEKVRAFTEDFCAYLETQKWFTSNWFLTLMRPFWGKANDQFFRQFLRPCLDCYTGFMKKGENVVTYDAPVALYFYGSAYSDPADPSVAATYAMLAAESLGLGTCMLGAIHPMIQNGSSAKKFREAHGIKNKSRDGLFVVMGYPAVHFKKTIRRTFASVDHI